MMIHIDDSVHLLPPLSLFLSLPPSLPLSFSLSLSLCFMSVSPARDYQSDIIHQPAIDELCTRDLHVTNSKRVHVFSNGYCSHHIYCFVVVVVYFFNLSLFFSAGALSSRQDDITVYHSAFYYSIRIHFSSVLLYLHFLWMKWTHSLARHNKKRRRRAAAQCNVCWWRRAKAKKNARESNELTVHSFVNGMTMCGNNPIQWETNFELQMETGTDCARGWTLAGQPDDRLVSYRIETHRKNWMTETERVRNH